MLGEDGFGSTKAPYRPSLAIAIPHANLHGTALMKDRTTIQRKEPLCQKLYIDYKLCSSCAYVLPIIMDPPVNFNHWGANVSKN